MRTSLLILIMALCTILGAQETPLTQIAGTDLHLQLPSGYSLIDDAPGIMNDIVGITFMQMGEMSYYDNVSDFDGIEAGYEEEGIVVKDRRNGKLGQYEAIILEFDSEPQICQAFFGNNDFCALVQIIGTPGESFVTEEVINDLGSITYRPSTIDPITEHAKFQLTEEVDQEWVSQGFNMGSFMFEHPASGDAILLLQLPAATWLSVTPKLLAQQFTDKYTKQGMQLNILLESETTVGGTPAYQYILELSGNAEIEKSYLYLVAFGNENAACVFNGLGEKDTPERRARFTTFLEQISFPEE
ncbi:MAG: hypothetical protein AAFY48_11335 [Bacteroidota bacterium]